MKWHEKYGPAAIVAGASEGLGAAFAEALAKRGLELVLIARREAVLRDVGTRLSETYGTDVHCYPMDLSKPELESELGELVRRHSIGLGVYNAAYAPVGAFLDQPISELERMLSVNARGPLIFSRVVGAALASRGHGGLVLMSSLAGFQGTPRLSTYAATKAFNTVLGEGLWFELEQAGVDVVTSCAGAIRTPGYSDISSQEAPGTLDAADVAEQTVAALGRGPHVVPGFVNQLAARLMGRWLPKRTAIRLMAKNTRDLG